MAISGGSLSFDVRLDASNLRGEKIKIENFLRQNPLVVPVGLGIDNRAAKQAQDRIKSQLQGQTVQINPEVNTRGIKSLKETVEKVQGNLKGVTKESGNLNAAIQDIAIGNIFADLADRGIDLLVDAFRNATDALVDFAAVSLDVARANQGVENSFRSLGLEADEIAEQLNFVRDVADQVGIDATDAGKNFAQFFAAARTSDPAVAIQDVQDVFQETLRVASIFGNTQDEINGALTALTQIASKGVVSMEELRQQLGERLPVAMNAAARGLGITTAELDELVSSGNLSAQEFFPAFAEGLRAIEGEINPVTQSLGRINNLIGDVQDSFGRAIQPLQQAAAAFAEDIFSGAFDNFDGFDSLAASANRLKLELENSPELAEQIGKAFAELANTGVEAFADVIDAITAFVANDEAMDNVAGSIIDVGLAIETLARIAQGLVGATELFFQQGTVLENLNETAKRTIVVYGGISRSVDLIRDAFSALQNPVKSVSDFLDALINRFDVLAQNPAVAALLETLKDAEAEVTALEGSTGGTAITLAKANNAFQEGIAPTVERGERAAEARDNAEASDNAEARDNAEDQISVLETLKAEQDSILSDIELRATQAEAALVGRGASEEEVAARERQALNERLSAREAFLADLNAINAESLSVEEAASLEKQIADTEQTIANDRLAVAQSVRDGKVQAAEEAAEKVIDQIEREREAESRRAEQQFEAESRTLQNNFDDGAEERAIDTERRVNAIKKAGEQLANQIKTSGENRVTKIKEDAENRIQAQQRDFADGQRRDAELFQAKQQAKERRFQEELQAFRDAESGRIDAAASEAEFQTDLRFAETPEERDQLKADRKAAEERAKILAEEQEKALRRVQEAEDLTPVEQARLALEEEVAARELEFQAQLNAEQQAFEATQRAEKQAFEDDIADQKKQTELEITELKKQTALELDVLEKQTALDVANIEHAAKLEERALQEQFENQMRQREEAFNAEQRRLDEESARRIEQIKNNASQGIAPQSLRSGGVVKDGPVQLHKDEFMIVPVGTRVVSQSESRRLVADHLANSMPAMQTTPSIRLPGMPNVSGSFTSTASSVSVLASRDRKLMQTLEEIRDAALATPGGNFNIYTQKPEIDIAYLERNRQRIAARRYGY